ncbi:MAG: T9SS type A sorting domain-containing protein [Chitinophagaceae bacterium]|nr:MAG: T9SS type A sorting domain-containing protein [Chitinophagaceae bacterium]
MRKILILLAFIFSSASAFAAGMRVGSNDWRWRSDDGSEASATWLAATGSGITIVNTPGQKLRLRIVIGLENLDATGASFNLGFGLNMSTVANGSFPVLVGTNATMPFIFSSSTHVTQGSATIKRMSMRAFEPGFVIGASNYTGSYNYNFTANQAYDTEFEWIIETTAALTPGTYYFRAAGAGGWSQPVASVTVIAPFSYPGSPFCGADGTVSPMNIYPAGGTYSGTPGLSIDATTGAVDLALSSASNHTATYSYNGGSTATAQVSVRPQLANPTGMNNVQNQAICAGTATSPVTFSSPIEGLSYSWTSSNPQMPLPLSGIGNIVAYPMSNNGTTTQYTQINVKATGGTGCTFRNMAFRIAVHPMPTVTNPGTLAICAGSVVAPMTFSGPVADTYFPWSSSNPAIGLMPRKGVTTVPAFTASGTLGLVSSFQVTPIANHCVGAPVFFDVMTMNCVAGIGNTGDEARISLDRSIVAGPNPTTGVVRVQYNGSAANVTLTVRNSLGNIVLPVQRMTGTTTSVDFGQLWPGTYSIQVRDATTGTSVTRTIVKL